MARQYFSRAKDTLDDLLYKYGEDLTDVQHIKLRQALYQQIIGLVGEDEIPNPEWELDNIEYGCNRLRAELRQKLATYFGVKE